VTVPRHEVFKPLEVGTYHCVSRCVRRAFLCGYDKTTGTSYEHRKSWLRDRLTTLVHIFAIELLAYAVMSNHLHSLLRNRPDKAAMWSPEEVARRWRTLFPLRRIAGMPAEPNEFEITTITDDPVLVETYRQRLSSLSWFSRCLSENIARRANKEDEVTGRFWEGRFKSQRVYDIGALLACSVYIDLNPIRAGIASTPEGSDFTSAQDRIRARQRQASGKTAPYVTPPLVPIEDFTEEHLSLERYLDLLDATGRQMVEGKGRIAPEMEDILTRLKLNPKNWLDTTTKLRQRFKRMVGSEASLLSAAQKQGKRWFQGLAAARAAFA